MNGYTDPRERLQAWILLGGLIVSACVLALRLGLPTRDALLLVGANDDGSVIFARMSEANTGLVDGQVTTRLALLPAEGVPVEHRAMHAPTDAPLGPDGVVAAPDALTRGASGWELRVGGDAAQARLTVAATQPAAACPPPAGSLRGTVQYGGEGLLLDGAGGVVRTQARGRAEEGALWIIARGVWIGVDTLSVACPAWAVHGETRWTGSAPSLPARIGEGIVVGPYRVTLEAWTPALTLEPLGHVTAPERWMGRLAGLRAASLRRVRVRVAGPDLPEGGVPRPGLLLDRAAAR